MYAASEGRLLAAMALVDAGAKLDSQDSSGWTALCLAAGRNHPAMVSLLVDREANTTLVDSGGKTARGIAVENGNTECATLLQ